MKIIIKGGRIIDPFQGLDSEGDILIEEGRISRVTLNPQKAKGQKTRSAGAVDELIDAKGMIVMPGLIDMHTHLRAPGLEYKETIGTGTKAAVRGGFTAVCSMPNTNPVNDNAGITEFILRESEAKGQCTVYPIGAITKGQKGEELAEMGMMRDAGCVAFSDDGRPVMNGSVMRRALEYSKVFDVPIISHSEDLTLSNGGMMNEGLLSTTMGLKGIPSTAEEVMVYRDIALSALTGGRIHIAHVSTKGSVGIIREAKKRGIRVTAETCPHYFSLTEDAVKGYNTNAKVNPPLRTVKDAEAVKEGLKDGTIDVIATDHAPHGMEEKLREFDLAPSGISGLETALPLSLRLVDEGVLTLSGLVEKLSLNPSGILGIEGGRLMESSPANIVIVDISKDFTVNAKEFFSKGKNTPFDGWTLKGMPLITIWKGRVLRWP
jgi:dihydroorotase